MNKNQYKLKNINLPEGLESAIFARIQKLDRRNILVRLWVAGSLTIASCVGTVFAVIYFIQRTATSGFSQYASLIFSDNTVLLSYWKEFIMSLIESLPLFELSLALIIGGVFIWSVARTTASARQVLAAH